MATLLRRSLNSTQFPKIIITLLVLVVSGLLGPGLYASTGWVSSGVATTHVGATAQQGKTLPKLEVGELITAELQGGETHVYQVTLAAGQYMHLVVDQQGINIVAALSGPDGKVIVESDSPNGAYGPEPMSLIAEKPGSHQLQVRSLLKSALGGRYEVKVSDLRSPTSQDQTRIAAERDLMEGFRIYKGGAANANNVAMRKWEAALLLWRKVGDRYEEALTLDSLGFVHNALGQKQKALEYFTQALPIQRAVGDRAGQAMTLNNLGALYHALGEGQKALEYYTQALPLWQAVGTRAGEARALTSIGAVYSDLGQKQKALKYYGQALPLWQGIGNRVKQATTVGKLGGLYDDLGEKQKALEYYARALTLWRALQDRRAEATMLNNLGVIYKALGEKQKALEYYTQALPLWRAVRNRAAEAVTLSNLGAVYDALGERQKALECYKRAVALQRGVED